MILPIVLSGLILLGDPIGDAKGDGSLIPPTATTIETVGGFDLEQIKLISHETLSIEIHLASPPSQLTLIEVYLDTDKGGIKATLPGSEMRLPKTAGWEYAFQITPEAASGYYMVDTTEAPVAGLDYYRKPLEVRKVGRVLTLETAIPPPTNVNAFAMIGLFHPFGRTPWKPLTVEPSPWSYASTTQTIPVIDLLAPTFEVQRTAINRQLFPNPRIAHVSWPWLILMITGITIASIGICFRLAKAYLARSLTAARVEFPLHSTVDGEKTSRPGKEALPQKHPVAPITSVIESAEVGVAASENNLQSIFDRPHVPCSANTSISQDLSTAKERDSYNPPEYSIKPRVQKTPNKPTDQQKPCDEPKGCD